MPNIDQLRVVLRNVSPLIWRRVLAGSDTSIAELHTIFRRWVNSVADELRQEGVPQLVVAG